MWPWHNQREGNTCVRFSRRQHMFKSQQLRAHGDYINLWVRAHLQLFDGDQCVSSSHTITCVRDFMHPILGHKSEITRTQIKCQCHTCGRCDNVCWSIRHLWCVCVCVCVCVEMKRKNNQVRANNQWSVCESTIKIAHAIMNLWGDVFMFANWFPTVYAYASCARAFAACSWTSSPFAWRGVGRRVAGRQRRAAHDRRALCLCRIVSRFTWPGSGAYIVLFSRGSNLLILWQR